MAGVPMMNGSSILEGYVPDFDATVGLHPSAAEEFVTMYQASA